MRKLGVALVLSVALVGAGCGGDDDEDSGGSAAQTTATTATTQGGSAQANAEGKQIFTQNCGGCHTLADAGTNGQAPNLDEIQPDQATVERQVTNGGGGMPAFGDKLSQAQITAVSQYVSSVAGQ
jgi:mono/diheme cytochrome c family protein